ncbi:hypothetical protein Cylst_2070 [Cylindrospermum stagnale PCC 7417]|uniref:DarT domain-containing protein n=1 Tax=Cylindrospermum stagnale PCC 7417 TaxID=56107 RepID=K9WXS1_9NOST|nr:DarT ssDNA thymidine ADP-ribosyltransferase family protein [Cylindrospermum stagnale]AFZ24312.1 hypothetical protein Cylst_2070 [Cylindrospermum stagnale PCC 7417]
MLCIDPIFISDTTTKLQEYGALTVNSDSQIQVNSSAQELFNSSNSILEPTSTKDAYYIDDPFEGRKIKTESIVNAPQYLVCLSDYFEISQDIQQIEDFTLLEIQEIIQSSNFIVTGNKKVTGFNFIDRTTQARRKTTIFVIQTNEIQFLVQEQELQYLSDVLTQLSEKGKLDWEDLFSQQPPACLYPSALIRSDATEAQAIKDFVAEREIEHLVHFTSIENLYGICLQGAVLANTKLRELKCQYNQIDPLRIDRKLEYVFCSVTYYNFLYHYLISSKSSCWVLLYIRTDYMWKDKTLFCETNAATDRGIHLGKGLHKLQSLFAPQVDARRGTQTRINKPKNLPTNIQAEVLVYESITLDDVIAIVVKNSLDVKKVRDAGWEGEIQVRPNLFQPKFDWI